MNKQPEGIRVAKGQVYRLDEEYRTDVEVLGFFRGHVRFRVLPDGQERACPLEQWRRNPGRLLCLIADYKGRDEHGD